MSIQCAHAVQRPGGASRVVRSVTRRAGIAAPSIATRCTTALLPPACPRPTLLRMRRPQVHFPLDPLRAPRHLHHADGLRGAGPAGHGAHVCASRNRTLGTVPPCGLSRGSRTLRRSLSVEPTGLLHSRSACALPLPCSIPACAPLPCAACSMGQQGCLLSCAASAPCTLSLLFHSRLLACWQPLHLNAH